MRPYVTTKRRPRVSCTCEQCGREFLLTQADIERGRGLFCGRACYGRSRTAPLADRFWAKVRKTDSCWLWTARRNKAGYGEIRDPDRGRAVLAHRVSWELHHGSIPDGQEVCHNCPGGDNPACVNPDHLFTGTQADNMRDASAKGRLATRKRPPPGSFPHGEKHHAAKLTAARVAEMRSRHAAGERQVDLARAFGVSVWTTRQIIKHRAWKHLD